jgi:hypothetical protein
MGRGVYALDSALSLLRSVKGSPCLVVVSSGTHLTQLHVCGVVPLDGVGASEVLRRLLVRPQIHVAQPLVVPDLPIVLPCASQGQPTKARGGRSIFTRPDDVFHAPMRCASSYTSLAALCLPSRYSERPTCLRLARL